METMRPSGPAKLSEVETDLYKEVRIAYNLKYMV